MAPGSRTGCSRTTSCKSPRAGSEDGKGMGFGQFLTILRARSGVMVFIVLAALATGAVVTLMWPKRYEATASVILDPKGEGSIWGTNASPPPAADNLVTTHLDLIASPTVALKVVAAL